MLGAGARPTFVVRPVTLFSQGGRGELNPVGLPKLSQVKALVAGCGAKAVDHLSVIRPRGPASCSGRELWSTGTSAQLPGVLKQHGAEAAVTRLRAQPRAGPVVHMPS